MAIASHGMERKKLIGMALIPVLFFIIVALVFLKLPHTYEPPFLLGFLNTLFLGLIPIIVAYFAMKVYMRNGSAGVVLIGSGVLIFGLGSIVAGWVNPLPGGPNMTVTIHNSCALLSSVFILVGAVLSNSTERSWRGKGSTSIIALTYTGIVIFVSAFALATLQGILPPFFVPGLGPTVLRQIVLENAIAFFAISSVLFMLVYRTRRSDFFFWCTIAIALVTIGLLAVFLQPSVGSPIGWVGRSAQYLGFAFILYAVLLARRSAIARDLPIEDVVANFFGDAEESYRQLVETASDAIITIDDNDRVLLWNSAAGRIFGYQPEEAVGSSFKDLVISDDYRSIVTPDDHNIPGNDAPVRFQEPLEIIGKRKDGTQFPVELTISRRWQDGRIICTYILRDRTERKKAEDAIRDVHANLEIQVQKRTVELADANLDLHAEINDRKHAETALKESENKYRSLVENTNDWVWTIDLKGYHTYSNPSVFDLLGYQASEIIGTNAFPLIHPDDQPHVRALLKQCIDQKVGWHNVAIRWLHKDGSFHSFESNASPILSASGQVTGFMGIDRDITERKELEKERDYHEQELMELSTSLATLNRKLNLLSSITRHDINNQLTVQMGYLSMLEKKQPDATHNEYFEKVSTAAKRISAMIQFTSEYDSIGVKDPTWQDIHILVDGAAKQAQLGNVMVKNDLPAGTEIFADPLVVKVFYNLMDNAVRYGGKITTLWFSAEECNGDHIIVCQDDGNGVPVEEKEKIFERGFGKNTGLGLALSREILSITGITICESGVPGKGARFEMKLPGGAWRYTEDK